VFGAATASAQTQSGASRWVIDIGIGINPSINGNVNSGAIGTLQGQTVAIVPHSYGDVFGTGIADNIGTFVIYRLPGAQVLTGSNQSFAFTTAAWNSSCVKLDVGAGSSGNATGGAGCGRGRSSAAPASSSFPLSNSLCADSSEDFNRSSQYKQLARARESDTRKSSLTAGSMNPRSVLRIIAL